MTLTMAFLKPLFLVLKKPLEVHVETDFVGICLEITTSFTWPVLGLGKSQQSGDNEPLVDEGNENREAAQ